MNNSIFYRKFIKWLPAYLLHKLIIKEKFDYEIAFMEGASTKVISGCKDKETQTYAWVHTDMKKYRWSQRSYRNVAERKKAYANINKYLRFHQIQGIYLKKFIVSLQHMYKI